MENYKDKCAGCGEPWPCSDSKRTDISGVERAKHFIQLNEEKSYTPADSNSSQASTLRSINNLSDIMLKHRYPKRHC